MGIVAPSAHHSGSTKSATNPSIVKVIQKILRSTALKCNGAAAPRLYCSSANAKIELPEAIATCCLPPLR
jgi:hypothetical protein